MDNYHNHILKIWSCFHSTIISGTVRCVGYKMVSKADIIVTFMALTFRRRTLNKNLIIENPAENCCEGVELRAVIENIRGAINMWESPVTQELLFNLRPEEWQKGACGSLKGQRCMEKVLI